MVTKKYAVETAYFVTACNRISVWFGAALFLDKKLCNIKHTVKSTGIAAADSVFTIDYNFRGTLHAR